jgi:hypothetical protein
MFGRFNFFNRGWSPTLQDASIGFVSGAWMGNVRALNEAREEPHDSFLNVMTLLAFAINFNGDWRRNGILTFSRTSEIALSTLLGYTAGYFLGHCFGPFMPPGFQLPPRVRGP